MSFLAAMTDLMTTLGQVVSVDPLWAALWWLSAVVLAGLLVYVWQRLLGS